MRYREKIISKLSVKNFSFTKNTAFLFLTSLCIATLAITGCAHKDLPKTEPIPFGDQVTEAADEIDAETPVSESQETTTEETETDEPDDELVEITLDTPGPGTPYIEATTPEDRALAAAAGAKYINEESSSELDWLDLAPVSPLANYWDLPERFDQYEVVGDLLVFEAHTKDSEIPLRLGVIREGSDYWFVKHFGNLQDDELERAQAALDEGAKFGYISKEQLMQMKDEENSEDTNDADSEDTKNIETESSDNQTDDE